MLVFLFVVCIMFVIVSPNVVSILLLLVSYFLEIYYQNVKYYGAGMLTAVSNG